MSACRFALACCALAGLGAACSSFGGSDDPGATTAPASDGGDSGDVTSAGDGAAGSEDASTSDGAKDAGDDSGVVFEDHFEGMAGGPCAGWMPNLGTAIVLAGAGRSGNACRVCSTADGGNGLLTKTLPTTAKGTWSTLAWIRQDPTSPTTPRGWALSTACDYQIDGSVTGIDTRSYTTGDFTDSYVLAQSTTPTPVSPLSEVYIRVSISGDAGQCFLLDDVQLFRDP